METMLKSFQRFNANILSMENFKLVTEMHMRWQQLQKLLILQVNSVFVRITCDTGHVKVHDFRNQLGEELCT